MTIVKLDYLVLTVKNIDVTVSFYQKFLGIEAVTFQSGRTALKFGKQKINLHEVGHEIEPKAAFPTPGSADLCLIGDTPINKLMRIFQKNDVEIILGPVERTGAEGKISSFYVRDPDQNLIEIANYVK